MTMLAHREHWRATASSRHLVSANAPRRVSAYPPLHVDAGRVARSPCDWWRRVLPCGLGGRCQHVGLTWSTGWVVSAAARFA